MSKAVSKGHIIDEYCTVKGEFVEENDIVYDCALNQTEIELNYNKFYIMQLIHSGSTFAHFIRYGRIGEKGRPSIDNYSDKYSAINAFEKQFKTKTGNNWSSVKNGTFVKKNGKYFMSEISYDKELKDIDTNASSTVPDSVLDKKVQALIKMLSDVNMMTNALIELDIDTKKLPLGKIKQTQLDNAGKILDELTTIIQEIDVAKTNKQNIDELSQRLVAVSSKYYTFVPYSCGRARPPVIVTNEMISKYRDVLDELGNIAITVQLTNNVKSGENPVDSLYKDINTKITPLDSTSEMWTEIINYVNNTHGESHGSKLQVLDIYEVEQLDKTKIYQDATKKINNKTLLFHGTPQNCVLSIFKRDFYLDPSKLKDVNVQIAGKMFGYGVYFADSCTKSFNYTRAQSTNNVGCLIMAEVALGKQSEEYHANYSINKDYLDKKKCHSTKGIGKWQPSTSIEIDGIKIPNGKLHDIKKQTDLRYNEHIVYDVNQVNIKYLVMVKNDGNYVGY